MVLGVALHAQAASRRLVSKWRLKSLGFLRDTEGKVANTITSGTAGKSDPSSAFFITSAIICLLLTLIFLPPIQLLGNRNPTTQFFSDIKL
ncbi:hypothetical protein XELAEV_18038204mg [Xenopus laevis]|uniref:Uncharacterized protein n=1 Tax=Xenopus laevis TaxID=8355 RepID=A0A974C5C4_XENLA|nr:hypothetical protein XELAEV_18038204mg [Xenopus laevis]